MEISDHDLKALSTITPGMWKKIMTAVAEDPVIQKSVAGAVRGDAPTGETTDPVLENILESSLGVTAALTALNGAKVIVGIALICAGITAPEFGPLALIALLVGGGLVIDGFIRVLVWGAPGAFLGVLLVWVQ